MTKNKIVATTLIALRALSVFLLLATAILYVGQDQMIYHPGHYTANTIEAANRQIIKLPYDTANGHQVAFYLPPKNGQMPQRLWLMFGGNGGLILQYRNGLPSQPALDADGFLLVDYPGYGYDEGRPSGSGIQDNANAAFGMLAARLGIDQKTLLARSGVVGHSLGTGVALEFAASHPEISRFVLVAPFTSLYDMAFRVVGPIAYLLHHNFDNAGVLRDLATRTPRPQVVIITGDHDQVIPVRMSRTLARDNPWLTYHELPGYEHNQIVAEAAPQIAAVMAGMK